MPLKNSNPIRSSLIWAVFFTVAIVPIIAAGFSEQLQWRDGIYILAGFAGIIAMALLLIQPLMIGEILPGLIPRTYRRIHRLVGVMLVLAVIIHVGALWITSPPDVIDALLFASPTPFSIWGVIAMWAVFITSLLAALRKRFSLPIKTWRIAHILLAITIIIGSIVHAMLIEGTMELISKIVLCAAVLLAALGVIVKRSEVLKQLGY